MEERAAWFSKPKRRIQYTISTDTADRTFAVEAALREALESAKAAVPLWGREQVIAGVTGATVQLERSAPNIEVGQWVGIAKPFSDVTEVAKVTSVNGSSIVTDSAVNALPGDLLVPLELGRIESVPSEVVGGAGRSFEIQFRGESPLESIPAEFVFTEVDTESNWLSFLSNLYFLFFIDTSGSMDADVPNVTAAANELKARLRDLVYGGDQAQADHFVRVQNWSSERWLDRLGYRVSGEQAARYVSLAFINEASGGYHQVPRNAANEPTSSFSNDYVAFQNEFARREYSRCKVYSIDPTAASWEDDNLAFNEHLTAAINGAGSYASLGQALASQFVSFETGIPSGRSAEEYLNDIFTLLGVR